MTLAVRFDDVAAVELAAVATWYDQKRPGHGSRFLLEVERLLALSADQPSMGRTAPPPPGARRLLVRRFPVALRYVVEGDVLRVLVVEHQAAAS